ncbi:MAG: hypothetical protein AB1898_05705 [Acidobacteriota bacterium]
MKRAIRSVVLVVLLFAPYGVSEIAAQDEQVVVPAGTKLKATLVTPISSKLSEPGDSVLLELLEPVRIDPQHNLARGTELTGKITHVKRAGRIKGKAEVYALINELTTYYGSEPIAVSIDSASDFGSDEKVKTDEEGNLESNRDLGDDLNKAAQGASLASMATVPIAISKGSVGTAIAGPAVGAAAGLLLSRGKEIRLPVGTVFRLKLDKDLRLPASVVEVGAVPGRPPARSQVRETE